MRAKNSKKGYVQMDTVVRRYLQDKTKFNSWHPCLEDSLLTHTKELNTSSYISDLPNNLSCLIEGYTTPRNAESLRKFLNFYSVKEPSIIAVDILNIPAIYQKMRIPAPEVDFILADASNLRSVFENEQFDLVVQDFLLNCAPPNLHHSILSEVNRILKKHGIALIQFSTLLERSLSNAIINEFLNDAISKKIHSYSIHDLQPETVQRSSELHGKLFRHPDDFYFYVTPDTGNYEFYRDQHQIFRDFELNGMNLQNHTTKIATDLFGQNLMRHYCLLTKRKNSNG